MKTRCKNVVHSDEISLLKMSNLDGFIRNISFDKQLNEASNLDSDIVIRNLTV